MTLSSIPLGNLDSSATNSSTASFICPARSFITRLDFQLVYHINGNDSTRPEGPYVSGINLFCSGIPTSFAVNMQWSPRWPNSIVMPVYGEGRLEGISDVVVYHDALAINRVAYGSTTAGRVRGDKWAQVGSQVAACRLKGVKLRHREWAEAAQLYFDCPDTVSSEVILPSTAAPASKAGHPTTPALTTPNTVIPIRASTRQPLVTDPLATSLYIILALLSILLVSLSVLLIRGRIRANASDSQSAKVRGQRRRRRRPQPGYELVDPAQFVLVPVDRRGLRTDDECLDEAQGDDDLYLPTSSQFHV